MVAYDWGRHTFHPATIEALELFSNSHISNSLLYAAAQVGSHFVATSSHLHQGDPNSVELVLISRGQGRCFGWVSGTFLPAYRGVGGR